MSTTARSNYTAEVEKAGKFWMIRVPEIGYVTQARHEGEIETMARDLIATVLDVAADSFELEVHMPAAGERTSP